MHRHDEIGALAEDVNVMTKSLAEQEREIEEQEERRVRNSWPMRLTRCVRR